MNINIILNKLGISKWRALWTILTGGMSGFLELVAEAFTNLLRNMETSTLTYNADLAVKIAKFIRYGIELFVEDEKYKKAGISTATELEAFADHVSDGVYTTEELNDDIDCIESCIELWKDAAKKD